MKNINKLSKDLKKFDNKLIKELIEAQQETAKVICDDVKELAPKKTGKYVESIKVGQTEVNGMQIETPVYTDAVVISSKGIKYNLGYLLETGTSPHIIEPVFAKVLHFQINGEDIFAKRVHHPGTVARPYFATALNDNKYLYKIKIRDAIRRSFNE